MIETHKSMSGTWRLTDQPSELTDKVRLAVAKHAGLSPALDNALFVAALDQPLARGKAFVVVLSDRVITRRTNGKMQTAHLCDIVGLDRAISGDVVLRTSGGKIAFFGMVTHPATPVLEATYRSIDLAWRAARTATAPAVPLKLPDAVKPALGIPVAAPVAGKPQPSSGASTTKWRLVLLGIGGIMVGAMAATASPVLGALAVSFVIIVALAGLGARVLGDAAPSGLQAALTRIQPHWREALIIGVGVVLAVFAHAASPPEATLVGAQSSARETVPTKRGPAPPSEAPVKYRVFDREVSDTPIKTQIELRVEVPSDITRTQMQTLMRRLFAKTIAEDGFRHHPHPTSVYAFFFYDEGVARAAPTKWIASMRKAHVEPSPIYTNNVPAGGFAARVNTAVGQRGDATSPLSTTLAIDDAKRRVEITTHNTEGGLGPARYAPTIEKWNLWFSVFYYLEQIFVQVPDTQVVRIKVVHKTQTLVDITVSQSAWKSMTYFKAMNRLADVENKLAEQLWAKRISAKVEEKRRRRAWFQFWKTCLKSVPAKDRTVKRAAAL